MCKKIAAYAVVVLTGMLRAYRSIFLVGRQECGQSVWWKTVCMEDPQLNEMYLIGAGANDLILVHPNWNAQSK